MGVRVRSWRLGRFGVGCLGRFGVGVGKGGGFVRFQALVAHHHAPEVAPPGPHDLRKVDDEERHVEQGEDEVDRPRERIAAEERDQPGELRRLVDRQPGQDRACAHDDDADVGEALRGVVAALRRGCLAEAEVVEGGVPGVAERVAIRAEVPPLAADDRVADVEDAVDREQPPEEVVVGHPAGKVSVEVEHRVEAVREEGEQSPTAPADAVDVVGPVDPQPAPDHDGQKRKVDPVHPAHGARVLLHGPARLGRRRGLAGGRRGHGAQGAEYAKL